MRYAWKASRRKRRGSRDAGKRTVRGSGETTGEGRAKVRAEAAETATKGESEDAAVPPTGPVGSPTATRALGGDTTLRHFTFVPEEDSDGL
jgi:hypothetical protein